jgi:hypothetical protein
MGRSLRTLIRRQLEPRDDPRPLALLRILLGLLTLAQVGGLWPLADFLFGDDGLAPPAEICGSPSGRMSLLCHLPGSAVPAFFVGFAIATLAFTVGFVTRVSTVLVFVGFVAFCERNPVYLEGDQVFWNFLFLLCFSRCGEAWSVDAWWRGRRGITADHVEPQLLRRIPAWPRTLMIVQLCVVYGANGWNKQGAGWLSGDALGYMLMNDRWLRVPLWSLVTYGEPVLRLGSWGAWWFERAFPLAGIAAAARAWLSVRDEGSTQLPSRAGRALRWLVRVPLGPWPWLGLTLIFHGTLMALLNLGWFVPASLVVGLCLLPRLPGTRLLPEPELPTSRPSSRARWLRAAIVAFWVWHALAMTQGSVTMVREATSAWLATPLDAWRRVTHTQQPWRMFADGGPPSARYLLAHGFDADGHPHAIPTILDWHVEPWRPYVGHERRRKVAARILQSERWQRAYARWLCRTARAPDGRPFVAVELRRALLRLPPPRWMAEHGPLDPYEYFAEQARSSTFHELDCEGLAEPDTEGTAEPDA